MDHFFHNCSIIRLEPRAKSLERKRSFMAPLFANCEACSHGNEEASASKGFMDHFLYYWNINAPAPNSGARTCLSDPRSQIPEPRSPITDHRSQITDPRSQIPHGFGCPARCSSAARSSSSSVTRHADFAEGPRASNEAKHTSWPKRMAGYLRPNRSSEIITCFRRDSSIEPACRPAS